MTVWGRDYRTTTGMHAASSASLSCADTNITSIVGLWSVDESRSFSQSRCFRPSLRHPSAPSVGVCAGRKLGPEEQSYKSLSLAVFPDRNVA